MVTLILVFSSSVFKRTTVLFFFRHHRHNLKILSERRWRPQRQQTKPTIVATWSAQFWLSYSLTSINIGLDWWRWTRFPSLQAWFFWSSRWHMLKKTVLHMATQIVCWIDNLRQIYFFLSERLFFLLLFWFWGENVCAKTAKLNHLATCLIVEHSTSKVWQRIYWFLVSRTGTITSSSFSFENAQNMYHLLWIKIKRWTPR